MAKPKPNLDQFLLQPNFWYICDNSPQRLQKTHNLIIHQFFYQGKKSQSTELG